MTENTLTKREIDCLELAEQGFTDAQIGTRLYITVNTVKKHMFRVSRQLGTTNRLGAIHKARRLGLFTDWWTPDGVQTRWTEDTRPYLRAPIRRDYRRNPW